MRLPASCAAGPMLRWHQRERRADISLSTVFSMAQDPSPEGSIRVGDGEREAVAAILQAAAADGRLSMNELDERLEVALQAKTYGDLDPLVADLSVEPPSHTLRRDRLPAQGPPPPGFTREDPLRLEGGMSSEKRRGPWTVPPFIRINQGMGSVKLDFLEATPAAQLIEIEVVGGAGSTVLVLPDGWAADADRLSKTWGSKSVKVPQRPAPGKPLLVIFGWLGLGSLKVRPASRFERRRMARKS
jgi:hypothetical protein